MAKREITIFDLLPADALNPIDEDGYSLLREHGYKVDKSIKGRRRLKKHLNINGDRLTYKFCIDKEKSSVLVWFELSHGNEVIGRSKGLKFMPKEKHGNIQG